MFVNFCVEGSARIASDIFKYATDVDVTSAEFSSELCMLDRAEFSSESMHRGNSVKCCRVQHVALCWNYKLPILAEIMHALFHNVAKSPHGIYGDSV